MVSSFSESPKPFNDDFILKDPVSFKEIYILILSYAIYSWLNLQSSCYTMIAFSPPTTYSVRLQATGRIVRVGQSKSCLVIQSFISRLKAATVNRLATLIASLSGDGAEEEFGAPLSKLDGKLITGDDGILRHKDDEGLPTDTRTGHL